MDGIIVKHPNEKFDVIFSRPTALQLDVIKAYNEIFKLKKEESNDSELGKKVRRILSRSIK